MLITTFQPSKFNKPNSQIHKTCQSPATSSRRHEADACFEEAFSITMFMYVETYSAKKHNNLTQ